MRPRRRDAALGRGTLWDFGPWPAAARGGMISRGREQFEGVVMMTVFLAIAITASAQTGLDVVKPAVVMAARKRIPLDCKDIASIRDFKAAVVEDSGWEHKLAEEFARYACPREADAAGWPDPRPRLPAKWRGALPAQDKNPDDHAGNIKSLVEGFLLYPLRPLPISRKQAEQIAEGWDRQRVADLQSHRKDKRKKP